jgi:tetratricopeptide (TPR) repeat protein
MTTSASSLTDGRRVVRRPRVLGVLAAAVLIAGASQGLRLVAADAPAGTVATSAAGGAGPTSPDVTVPGSLGGPSAEGSIATIDHSIAAWTKNLDANEHDFLSATNLAILYHGRGRLSADLADQQKALAAARTAMAIVPGDAGPRALEATVLYALHDFAGAFAAADALYREDPTQLGALATRLDAELELGRIDAARADLATLRLATSGPAIDIRAARLASVTGDSASALALAGSALASAAADEDADLGFFQYAVGEYARLAGDPVAARAAYSGALAIRSTDLAAIVGLARVDAYEMRMTEAIDGLRRAAVIAPQPETLALLGDLLVATGDLPGAETSFTTVRFIERLDDIESTVFDRVLLRFELDHGGATEAILASARASLDGRPDTTGHDTVAWALYRLGRFDEAATEIGAASVGGAAGARLTFHAGAIALARGDAETGRAALARALALGPALDPVERAEAERLLGR